MHKLKSIVIFVLYRPFMKINYKNFALAIVCSLLFACQPTEKQQEEQPVAEQTIAAPDTVKLRPAPEFFFFEKGQERKRVWVCDDGKTDVFHVDNTCELLLTCTGTYRNVSLARAIEEYGRYNCESCSQELADVFNEDKVRFNKKR